MICVRALQQGPALHVAQCSAVLICVRALEQGEVLHVAQRACQRSYFALSRAAAAAASQA
jgi:hypothetical protein